MSSQTTTLPPSRPLPLMLHEMLLHAWLRTIMHDDLEHRVVSCGCIITVEYTPH